MSITMVNLYILVLLLNIVFSFRKKHSNILLIVSVVFLLAGVAGSVDNPDYFNYYEWYLGKWVPPTVEKGYLFISDFFGGIGLPYSTFLAITDLFSLGIYLLIIKTYNQEYHVFIAMYMGYQLFLDYVQRRHTIATAILVFGIYFLANRKRILYIITVFLSFLIHKSFLIYLPFVYLNPESKFSKRAVKVMQSGIVIACFFIFLNGNRIPFLSNLANLSLLEGKYERYFTTTTRFGFVLPWITHACNIIIAYVSINIIKTNNNVDEKSLDLITILCYFVFLSSFALPLTMINEEFIRYFRCCNIFVSLISCETFKSIKLSDNRMIRYSKGIRTNRELYPIMILIDIIIWHLIYTPSDVVKVFFSNNMWFR